MLKRIIDKETQMWLRDDFIFDEDTEQAIDTICPDGFNKPKWNNPIFENCSIVTYGHWSEGEEHGDI